MKKHHEFIRHTFFPTPIKDYTESNGQFKSENDVLKVQKALNKKEIFPRRYFYPSLNTLEYISKQYCPISEDISARILCLPLYSGLQLDEIKNICNYINSVV